MRTGRFVVALLVGLAGAGIVPHAAMAQESAETADRAVRIADLLRIAEEKNPELAAAAARVRQAEGRLRQAHLYPNPELEIEEEDIPLDPIDAGEGRTRVTIGQPIIIGGRRRAEIAEMERELEAAQLDHDATRRRVFDAVRRNALEMLYYGEWWSQHYGHLEEAEDTLDAVEAAQRDGHATAGEVARAQAEVEDLALQVTKIVAERIYSAQRLQVLLGGEWIAPDRLAGELATTFKSAAFRYDTAAALERHPTLAAAVAREASATAGIKRADREAIPDVTFMVGGGYNHDSEESFGSVGLRVPIPVWNRNQGRRDEARAMLVERQADSEGIRVELRRRLEDTLQRINEYDTLASVSRDRLVPAAATGFHDALEGFKERRVPFVDLLDAQRGHVRAEDARLEYEYQLSLSYATMVELIGDEAEGLLESK